jgi:hypothetical protein
VVLVGCVGIAPLQSYNVRMRASAKNATRVDDHHGRHHVYAMETTGLLIIAIVLLIVTLIRYWDAIHWSLR